MAQVMLLGDCRDHLAEVEENSVDLLIADPPYNISADGKIHRPRLEGLRGSRPVRSDQGTWDHGDIYPAFWVPWAYKTLTPEGVFISFYAKERLQEYFDLFDRLDMKLRHVGAWLKTNPIPQVRKTNWMNGWEAFVVATVNHGRGHHFNTDSGQSPDWYLCPTCSYDGEKIKHPTKTFDNGRPFYHTTQKPIKLIRWLIEYWSFRGDQVLDPFAGVGTVAQACWELGRSCISIEQDPDYFEMMKGRILPLTRQSKLEI